MLVFSIARLKIIGLGSRVYISAVLFLNLILIVLVAETLAHAIDTPLSISAEGETATGEKAAIFAMETSTSVSLLATCLEHLLLQKYVSSNC